MLLIDNASNEGDAAINDDDYDGFNYTASLASVHGFVVVVAVVASYVFYNVFACIIVFVSVTIVDE